MPRVTINKQKYIKTDFSKWLVGEMYAKDLTQGMLAEQIGMSQQLLSHKLKTGTFSLENLISIFQALGTEKEEVGRILGGR